MCWTRIYRQSTLLVLDMSECSIFIKSRGKKRLGRSRCADVLESDLCVLLEQLRKCKKIKK